MLFVILQINIDYLSAGQFEVCSARTTNELLKTTAVTWGLEPDGDGESPLKTDFMVPSRKVWIDQYQCWACDIWTKKYFAFLSRAATDESRRI